MKKIFNLFALIMILLSTLDCKKSGNSPLKDNGNGTLTDTRTNLMWQQKSTTAKMNWEAALNYAKNLNFAGYTNWRLPTLDEFKALLIGHLYDNVQNGAEKPSTWLNKNGFKDINDDPYWSSSPNETNNETAWALVMKTGYIGNLFKNTDYNVLCVRAAQ
jgi:hypothetical protein